MGCRVVGIVYCCFAVLYFNIEMGKVGNGLQVLPRTRE